MGARKHWWNGIPGGMGRHDLIMREDAGRWTVEHRNHGREIYLDYEDEDRALEEVRRRMALVEVGAWRELSTDLPSSRDIGRR